MKLKGPDHLSMRIPLPNGGTIVLDRGEAMYHSPDGMITDEIPDELVPDTVYSYGYARVVVSDPDPRESAGIQMNIRKD